MNNIWKKYNKLFTFVGMAIVWWIIGTILSFLVILLGKSVGLNVYLANLGGVVIGSLSLYLSVKK